MHYKANGNGTRFAQHFVFGTITNKLRNVFFFPATSWAITRKKYCSITFTFIEWPTSTFNMVQHTVGATFVGLNSKHLLINNVSPFIQANQEIFQTTHTSLSNSMSIMILSWMELNKLCLWIKLNTSLWPSLLNTQKKTDFKSNLCKFEII